MSQLHDVEEIGAVVPAENATSSKPFHLPEQVTKGSRHELMRKLLRSQKARGISFEAAVAACDIENKTKCDPPLGDKDLEYQRWWNEPDRPGFGATSQTFVTYTKPASKKGQIIPDHQGNVRLALAQLGLDLSYNAFAAKDLATYQGSIQLLDDVVVQRAWLQVDALFHFRPTLRFFEIVIKDLARRSSFHPVRDYLDRLKWDTEPRIDRWLATYGGAEDTGPDSSEDQTYLESVSSLFLIAAVRRVRTPGCKFDEMLILEAPQGTLKSSALRVLCPDDNWFSDDLPLGVSAKEIIERTAGKWIIEASELQGYTNAQVDHLKSATARQTDGPVRLAYGHFSVEVPRQFVMVGTTNKLTEYLRDSTGNRRFWPVRIAKFDVAALARDRDHLWAEAAYREAQGESIRLPERLWPAATIEQDLRRQVDPWEELLGDSPLLDWKAEAIPVESLWLALGEAGRYFKRNDAERLAQVMQRFGYTRKKKIDVVCIQVADGAVLKVEDTVRKWVVGSRGQRSIAHRNQV